MAENPRSEFDKVRDALECLNEAERALMKMGKHGEDWRHEFYRSFQEAKLLLHSFVARLEEDRKRLVVEMSKAAPKGPLLIVPDRKLVQ